MVSVVEKEIGAKKIYYLHITKRTKLAYENKDLYLGSSLPENIREKKLDFFISTLNDQLLEISNLIKKNKKDLPKTILEKNLLDFSIKFTYNSNKIEGNTAECLTRTNIDTTKVNACIAATDSMFKVTELYNDKSTWQGGSFPQFNVFKEENNLYGVQGSPTTVINGVVVDRMPRDSAGILNQVCLAFNNQPSECQTKLSSTAPGPGFGYDSTGTNSTASCS